MLGSPSSKVMVLSSCDDCKSLQRGNHAQSSWIFSVFDSQKIHRAMHPCYSPLRFQRRNRFLHQRKPRKTLVMPRFLQFLLAASALSLASASDIAAARPHLMALRGGATTSDLSMPQQAVAMMAASVGVTQQIRATGFLPPPEPVAPHEPAVAVVKLVTSVVVKIFEDLLIHFGLAEKRTQASHRTQAAIVIGFLGLSKVFPGKRLQTKDPDRFLEYLPDRKAYLASYSA